MGVEKLMVDRDSHVGFVQRASVFLETPDSVEKIAHHKNDIFANLFQFVCTSGFGRSINVAAQFSQKKNVAAHNIVKLGS